MPSFLSNFLGNRVVLGIVAVVGVPLATIGYVALVEWVIRHFHYKARPRIRPWLWLAPALIIISVYLIYPSINTIYLSFLNSTSTKPVGFANYVRLFKDPASLNTLKNNLLWLVLLAGGVVILGLTFAVLFDRVRYESAAKSLVFIPMAISFVAASIIFKLIYDYQPPPRPQTGTLNAIVVALGFQPVPWLIDRTTNTIALILVGVWMWTGFGLVILSAGLKSIPQELIEAARVDGATEWQVLFKITIPMMASTIAVVATTMIINALKAFDLVWVMTGGQFGTDVLATQMYKQMFLFTDFGFASAVATVLLLAIAPVMVFNIRSFQIQEAIR